jgi:hypothetical protein
MISPFEFLDYNMLNVYNWDSNGIGPWKREMRNIDINKRTLFLYYLYMEKNF